MAIFGRVAWQNFYGMEWQNCFGMGLLNNFLPPHPQNSFCHPTTKIATHLPPIVLLPDSQNFFLPPPLPQLHHSSIVLGSVSSSGSSDWVGGARNMKSMPPPWIRYWFQHLRMTFLHLNIYACELGSKPC